jgi:hypothetical protein
LIGISGMAQYGKQEYWDSRYSKDPDSFEWFQHWTGFRDIVSPLLEPSQQILVVGCGNSSMKIETFFLPETLGMSEDLSNDGMSNITSIDFSPVVIKSMQEKYKDRTGLQCM